MLHLGNLSLGGILLKDAHDIGVRGDELFLDFIVPDARGEPELHALHGTDGQVLPGQALGIRFDWHQSMLPARAGLMRFIERAVMDTSPAAHAEAAGLSTTAEAER